LKNVVTVGNWRFKQPIGSPSGCLLYFLISLFGALIRGHSERGSTEQLVR